MEEINTSNPIEVQPYQDLYPATLGEVPLTDQGQAITGIVEQLTLLDYASQVIDIADQNRDGKITEEEALESLLQLRMAKHSQDEYYDINGDGVVDLEDQLDLKNLYSNNDISTGINSDIERISRIVNRYDGNHDGIISDYELSILYTDLIRRRGVLRHDEYRTIAKYLIDSESSVVSKMDAMDANGDGTLNGDEAAKYMVELQFALRQQDENFDVNNDGQVSGKDYVLLMEVMKARLRESGVDLGAELGSRSGISAKSVFSRMGELISAFDEDQDGVMSAEEISKLDEAVDGDGIDDHGKFSNYEEYKTYADYIKQVSGVELDEPVLEPPEPVVIDDPPAGDPGDQSVDYSADVAGIADSNGDGVVSQTEAEMALMNLRLAQYNQDITFDLDKDGEITQGQDVQYFLDGLETIVTNNKDNFDAEFNVNQFNQHLRDALAIMDQQDINGAVDGAMSDNELKAIRKALDSGELDETQHDIYQMVWNNFHMDADQRAIALFDENQDGVITEDEFRTAMLQYARDQHKDNSNVTATDFNYDGVVDDEDKEVMLRVFENDSLHEFDYDDLVKNFEMANKVLDIEKDKEWLDDHLYIVGKALAGMEFERNDEIDEKQAFEDFRTMLGNIFDNEDELTSHFVSTNFWSGILGDILNYRAFLYVYDLQEQGEEPMTMVFHHNNVDGEGGRSVVNISERVQQMISEYIPSDQGVNSAGDMDGDGDVDQEDREMLRTLIALSSTKGEGEGMEETADNDKD